MYCKKLIHKIMDYNNIYKGPAPNEDFQDEYFKKSINDIIFDKRIFPIVLSDAKIYDPVDSIEYIKYWDDKIEELNQKIKAIRSAANLNGIMEHINNYTKYREIIDDFSNLLRKMNTLSPQAHTNSKFKELISAIEKQYSSNFI